MSASEPKEPVLHLVGSIPMDDAESVFRGIARALGPHLKRLPDGETGRRVRWIGFVQDILERHPDLERDPDAPPYHFVQWDGKVVFEINQLRFKPGVDPATVAFETGYADDAVRNFASFDRLQRDGAVPAGIKYQICMASPLAVTTVYIVPDARPAFLEVYTKHLIGEVGRIAAALPHERISYQWDVCQEVLMWEGYFPQPEGFKQMIFDSLGRIGDAVPATIELGYHLCYGSPRDEHLVQPKDMANVVEMANGICAAVHRPISYIHMPVPKDRSDDAFFVPLERLDLPDGTELYLGLIHDGDDTGNRARLAAARKYAEIDGIGSECGWGRAGETRLEPIVEAHRQAIMAASGDAS